jgi:hypothetical protein
MPADQLSSVATNDNFYLPVQVLPRIEAKIICISPAGLGASGKRHGLKKFQSEIEPAGASSRD